MGATRDGKITAAELELAFEAGAYPGSPVMQGATCGLACYNLENAVVEGYDVMVNKPKTAAYRAPGSPQAAFGVEQVVDELGVQLGWTRCNSACTTPLWKARARWRGRSFSASGWWNAWKRAQP